MLPFLDCISFDSLISQNEQMSKLSKESVKYGKYDFKGFTWCFIEGSLMWDVPSSPSLKSKTLKSGPQEYTNCGQYWLNLNIVAKSRDSGYLAEQAFPIFFQWTWSNAPYILSKFIFSSLFITISLVHPQYIFSKGTKTVFF